MSERVNANAILSEGADHLNPNLAPRPDQPFTEMSDMLAAQNAASGPEVPRQPPVLRALGQDEWRFLTRLGLASTAIYLRLPIESDDVDENVIRKNKHKRWLDRQIKQTKEGRKSVGAIYQTDVGKDGLLKSDKAVFDLLGEYVLRFRPVRTVEGHRVPQAEYVTTHKVVADYIRGRLERGEFAGEIYEDVRPVTLEVNGVVGRYLPADDATRVAMAAAAAGD